MGSAMFNLPKTLPHTMTIISNNNLIPDRASTGSTRAALPVPHQGRGDKYATGVFTGMKMRPRNNITIGTWNVRPLRTAGKLEELSHEMSKYRWNVLGLGEV